MNAGPGSNGYLRDAPIAFEQAGFSSVDPYTVNGGDNALLGIISGWHSRSADGSGGQLGSLGILAYAMSNIGFKDSHFCTEGDDMYFKATRPWPRTRSGNPKGEICLANDVTIAGFANWPSLEGALWTNKVKFLKDHDSKGMRHGILTSPTNCPFNDPDCPTGVYCTMLNAEVVQEKLPVNIEIVENHVSRVEKSPARARC